MNTGVITVSAKKYRIHPYKFNMWLVLAAIVMFFAAFTSAYMVMQSRNAWQSFKLPEVFWFSTGIILISSLTMHLSLKYFKDHRMHRYKMLITLTALLGVTFLAAQTLGFANMYSRGLTLQWNLSAALIYIIVGAHMVHVLGGVIALLVIFARAYRRHTRTYDAVPVEVVATYWHFVDGLWIYLYLFFLLIR